MVLADLFPIRSPAGPLDELCAQTVGLPVEPVEAQEVVLDGQAAHRRELCFR
jgi:hypothetical protein